MHILGINAHHADSSACLLRDGVLIAAIEEERLRRAKHWAGFPIRAIEHCLAIGGIGISEVRHVAVNRRATANLVAKASYVFSHATDMEWLMARCRRHRRPSTVDELRRAFPGQRIQCEIHGIEHHIAHLASAFYVSPFDEAVVVSVDGFGDFASGCWGVGQKNTIVVDDRVVFPHSLGTFYEAMTQFLGFPHWGDEYKVMGLAPYGKPVYQDLMTDLVDIDDEGKYRLNRKYFVHHKRLVSEVIDGIPKTRQLFSAELEKLLGPKRKEGEPLEDRHRDIARSVQATYERVFFKLLNVLHGKYGGCNLALAGGCAMNSVANGRAYNATPFRNLYVQAAAGDAGGAIGAAYSVWHDILKRPRTFQMQHAYCGPEYGDAEVRTMLAAYTSRLKEEKCEHKWFEQDKMLYEVTADAIANGKVVGWFQGRMEWGPRALGNRSILADPRRRDMKDIINLKIKRRESFRPFAPSILREAVPTWFENVDDVPFMMQVFQIKEEKRVVIPAVTHVDGSGRLQTVSRETNPRYHDLITAFAALTGVPIVLNTSFNENEPVVCRPEEALNCFMRTQMDVLVINNHYIYRNQ